jgi:hypothetical protein
VINWLYKIFKAEEFSFFKQLLVWLKIMPTFVSLFFIFIYFSISAQFSHPIFNTKSIKDTIENNSSNEIIKDSITNDINYQLERLKKERDNLKNDETK